MLPSRSGQAVLEAEQADFATALTGDFFAPSAKCCKDLYEPFTSLSKLPAASRLQHCLLELAAFAAQGAIPQVLLSGSERQLVSAQEDTLEVRHELFARLTGTRDSLRVP